jgi:dTMP kinase
MDGRGRLLAFEGIDGCGKTTQATALASALGAVLTREPGATPLGARLRELLLAPPGAGDPGTGGRDGAAASPHPAPAPRTEALLMAADRAEHVARVIEPALSAGVWVVTDRFSGSTLAYQGYGRGLDLSALRDLVSWATDGLTADLSVLVDVPVEVAAARLAAGSGGAARLDRMERLGPAFATRVRDGFLAQADADPSHWLVVDGEMPPDELTAHIVAAVRTRLGEAPAASR